MTFNNLSLTNAVTSSSTGSTTANSSSRWLALGITVGSLALGIIGTRYLRGDRPPSALAQAGGGASPNKIEKLDLDLQIALAPPNPVVVLDPPTPLADTSSPVEVPKIGPGKPVSVFASPVEVEPVVVSSPLLFPPKPISAPPIEKVPMLVPQIINSLYPDLPLDCKKPPAPITMTRLSHPWLEDEVLCPKTVTPALLANNGNTCFLASIMHAFIGNKNLIKALDRCVEILEKKDPSSRELAAFFLLQNFLSKYKQAQESGRVIKEEVTDLRNVLTLLSPQDFPAGRGGQEDVTEVLGLILSKMKDVFFAEKLDREREELFSDIRIWTATSVEPSSETKQLAQLFPVDPQEYTSLQSALGVDPQAGIFWEGRGKNDQGLWNGNVIIVGIPFEKKTFKECYFTDDNGTKYYETGERYVVKEGVSFSSLLGARFFEDLRLSEERGLNRTNQLGEEVSFAMQTKRSYAEHGPQTWIMYLNRFNLEAKIQGEIHGIEEGAIFSEEYFLNKQARAYRLDSVILHFGNTKSSGHYKIVSRTVTPEGVHHYFLCDDAASDGVYRRPIHQEVFMDLCRKHGYVLFWTEIEAPQ